MDPSTTLKKLKEQAELNSLKKLQSLFSTSDQLEQIQQHLNRFEKKKVRYVLSMNYLYEFYFLVNEILKERQKTDLI